MVITKIGITSYPLDCNNNNQEKQCLFIWAWGSSHQGLCLRDSAKPFFYWSFLKSKHHSLPNTYIFYKDAKVLYSCRLLWTKFHLQCKDLKTCVVGCNTVDHQHTQIILNSSEFSMVHYLAQNFFIGLHCWEVDRFSNSFLKIPTVFRKYCNSSFARAKGLCGVPTHEKASKILGFGLGLGLELEYETWEEFFAQEVFQARHQQEE